jgi:hypothetical protein
MTKGIKRPYSGPNTALLYKHLPDMGQSLDTGCCNLAMDCTLENADKLLAKIEGARAAVQQIRRGLAEGGGR